MVYLFIFLAEFNLTSKTYIEAVDGGGEIFQLMQTRQLMTIMPLMGSNIVSPGVIKVVNPQNKIKTFVGGKLIDQNKLELISQTLNNSLIPNTISPDINKNFLEKLQFALAINVMSALLDQFNGQVFKSESNQNYVHYIIQFVANLAKALGIENLRDYNAFKALNISEMRYSSMHEDIANGKIPEVKIIISAPLEIAYHFNLTISTKPLEFVESLMFVKSNNISISLEQIQELNYEVKLALNETEVPINILGENSNF